MTCFYEDDGLRDTTRSNEIEHVLILFPSEPLFGGPVYRIGIYLLTICPCTNPKPHLPGGLGSMPPREQGHSDSLEITRTTADRQLLPPQWAPKVLDPNGPGPCWTVGPKLGDPRADSQSPPHSLLPPPGAPASRTGPAREAEVLTWLPTPRGMGQRVPRPSAPMLCSPTSPTRPGTTTAGPGECRKRLQEEGGRRARRRPARDHGFFAGGAWRLSVGVVVRLAAGALAGEARSLVQPWAGQTRERRHLAITAMESRQPATYLPLAAPGCLI